ncbi:unnamed protein product [Angiostrongylus costaricensis]|uniref:Bestrophin homolog n=1 Tax=Angiostrongylus costaricensis TaxID=334426 RepID=A0A0R3PD15_ANGCS|nr:unnamed protein product [Angiostrongylus costaricensis]
MIRYPLGELLLRRFFLTRRHRAIKEVLLPLLIGVTLGYVFGFIVSFEDFDSIDHIAEVPALWTYIGDEQGFLVIGNLRKLVHSYNHRHPIMFGRIFMQKSILSYVFPFLQRERMSVRSGVVMSTSGLRRRWWRRDYGAILCLECMFFGVGIFYRRPNDSIGAIKNISKCTNFFLPRATEIALIKCAKQNGIRAVNPVDELKTEDGYARGKDPVWVDEMDNGQVDDKAYATDIS